MKIDPGLVARINIVHQALSGSDLTWAAADLFCSPSIQGNPSKDNMLTVKKHVFDYTEHVKKGTQKYNRLRDMDLFVLDNSLRESTVGQLRGHTLEDKWQVFDEVKRCGFTDIIVASFSHMTRVDDVFVKKLVERGEDRKGLYAFSEITTGRGRPMGSIQAI